MTKEKIKQVLSHYIEAVLKSSPPRQLKFEQYRRRDLRGWELRSHLHWMCLQILDGHVTGEKMHRWLGYIQGELRALRVYSVNELRRHSRDEAEADLPSEEAMTGDPASVVPEMREMHEIQETTPCVKRTGCAVDHRRRAHPLYRKCETSKDLNE